jgi:low temperature requirement protein LtrA
MVSLPTNMRASLVRPIRLRSADGAEAGRRVTWLELFFDLAFVAAVAQVGTPLTTDYSPTGLLRYTLLFFLIWWAWLGHTVYATRFDTDDVIQRLLTLAQIFGVAIMAVNADDALNSRSSAGFAAAYAGLRVILVFQYLRARHVPRAREFVTASAAGFGLAAVPWFVSAIVPPPMRYALWAFALVIDLSTPLFTARYTAKVPPHAEHLPERFGLFTIILIGESLVSVMKGMKSQEDWSVAAASSALLGLTVAFTLWWWYFDGVGAVGEMRVQSKRDSRRFHAWAYAHFPLYLGIAVAGVGVEHVIHVASHGHLRATETWILCGALATAMAAVTTIAASRQAGHDERASRKIGWHYAVAGLTLLVAISGPWMPPAIFLLALVAVALTQLVLSLQVVEPQAHSAV